MSQRQYQGRLDEPGLSGVLRATLAVFLLLAVGAVLALYVTSERTAEVFAWPIQPPLTAAMLGAAYGGALVLFAMTVGAPDWARGRAAVPAPFVLSVAMLAATLLHLESFSLDAGGVAGVVAWIWLVVYIVVPPLLLVMFVVHRNRPVPRLGPALPGWARAVGWLVAVVLLGAGIALFVAPEQGLAAAWPWPLSPLTSRAIAAWVLAMSATMAHMVIDGDLVRIRPLVAAMATMGVMGIGAVLRYPDPLDTTETVIVSSVLGAMVLAGAAGLLAAAGILRARSAGR